MLKNFLFETTEDAINSIHKGLQDNHWIKIFCVLPNGEKTVSYYEEEDVKQMSYMLAKGFFQSEENMMNSLHDILADNVKTIAEWLLNKERALTITGFLPAAIPLYINGEKAQNTRTVHVYLRKDREDKLPCGFFVSSFQAIKE